MSEARRGGAGGKDGALFAEGFGFVTERAQALVEFGHGGPGSSVACAVRRAPSATALARISESSLCCVARASVFFAAKLLGAG